MDETSKSSMRRATEGFDRYLRGRIIDIGAGEDLIQDGASVYDRAEGDAQFLANLEDSSYDTVYSSHCLEHMRDPLLALLNWWRVLKPGGYMIVAAPDEDLYEQCIWPSAFNTDHKWTLTLSKDGSWSPVSRNLLDMIRHLPRHRLIYARTIDTGYDHAAAGRADQTLGGAEAQIEVVLLKQGCDPDVLSTLPQVFPCECGARQYRLEGATGDGALRLTCMACGLVVDMELKRRDKEAVDGAG